MRAQTYRVYVRCRNCNRPFYTDIAYGNAVCQIGQVTCPICGIRDMIGLYIDPMLDSPVFGHTQISYNEYKRLKQEWDEESTLCGE